MTTITISGGTTVLSATAQTGDQVVVLSGGTAVAALISGGAEQVVGVDSGSTVLGGGFQLITSGGTAIGTLVEQGAVQSITAAGSTLSAQIADGGTAIVTSGAALGARILAGGTEIVSATGIASSGEIASGALLLVGSGGTVAAITLHAGAEATLSSGGLLEDVTVNSGGLLLLQSGGRVDNLTVDSGGHVIVTPGVVGTIGSGDGIIDQGIALVAADSSLTTYASSAADLNIASGTRAFVLSGGVISGGTLLSGSAETIYAGGTSLDQHLSASTEVVQSGGQATGTIVKAGGVQYVFAGAEVSATQLDRGYAFVNSGGTASDLRISAGGIAAVDGTVSGTQVESGGGLYVVETGTAIDTHIESGGFAYLDDHAISTTISAGGYAVVSGPMSLTSGTSGISATRGTSGTTATTTTVLSGGSLIQSGIVVLSGLHVASGGLVLLGSGGTGSDVTVDAGGTLILLPGSDPGIVVSGSGATVFSGGDVTISGGTAVSASIDLVSGLTLGSGASGTVYAGGAESGATIGLNATDTVGSGGTATDETIGAGGTLVVDAGGVTAGTITFGGADGSLIITSGAALGHTVVSGLNTTDSINFAGFNPNGTLSVSLGGSNLLTASDGTTSATVHLDPTQKFAGESFAISVSSSGGANVTLVHDSTGASAAGSTGASVTPIDVPIYALPFNGSYKLGIEVSLDGGHTYKMVELDTGASGFFAAYTPDWWGGSYTPVSQAPDVMTYVSGNDYAAQVVNTAVTLQTSSGTGLTVGNVNVGLITTASNSTAFTTEGWNTGLTSDPTSAPLEDYFYGDFGLGLNDNSGIEAVLGQLTGGLSDGFIINIGTYPEGAGGQVGTLQIGLTEENIASYHTIIALDGQSTTDTFANSGLPTYAKAQADGAISIDGTVTDTHFVFDTGATQTDIFSGTTLSADGHTDESGNALTSGSSVVLSAPGATDGDMGWALSIASTGTVAGVDSVHVSPSAGTVNPGAVNTGIGAYWNNSVMFDIADGIMGFSSVACFAAGTRIATVSGERVVESLAIGDEIRVLTGETLPIVWVGHRTVDCLRHPDPASVQPVRIAAQAFGPGEPLRDLILSPDHALYRSGVLIPVKHLINGTSIRQESWPRVTYYHVELPHHDILLAEGLAAESYLDTGLRAVFSGGPVEQAHPRFALPSCEAQLIWSVLGYAPLVVSGPVVAAERARLAAGLVPVACAAATNEPMREVG